MVIKFFLIVLIILLCLLIYLGNFLIDKFIRKILDKYPPRRLVDTNRWCNTTKKVRDWEEDNPFIPKSDPEYQELLRIMIGAYMLWLDSHPHYDGRESLQLLVDRLED